MKKISLNYHNINVSCTCGNTFITKSTYSSDNLKLEVCSHCHPFYTGKQRVIDVAGRVDVFRKRFGKITTS